MPSRSLYGRATRMSRLCSQKCELIAAAGIAMAGLPGLCGPGLGPGQESALRFRGGHGAQGNGAGAPQRAKRWTDMSAERPILIVDDDGVLRETLADQLAVDGEFAAVAAASIGEAEERLNAKDARFDAVILDVSLPDGDGRDLCTRLRKQGQKMPIIMLTGSDAETDVVRGLDSGANDYIAKPFRLAELLARDRKST